MELDRVSRVGSNGFPPWRGWDRRHIRFKVSKSQSRDCSLKSVVRVMVRNMVQALIIDPADANASQKRDVRGAFSHSVCKVQVLLLACPRIRSA